jgi:hypothetical protein
MAQRVIKQGAWARWRPGIRASDRPLRDFLTRSHPLVRQATVKDHHRSAGFQQPGGTVEFRSPMKHGLVADARSCG